MNNLDTTLESANDFLQGKSRPTINIGFDVLTSLYLMGGLLVTIVLAGLIIKKM